MHKVPKTSWFIFHMGEVVAQDNCKHYSSLHKEFMYFECTSKFTIQDNRIKMLKWELGFSLGELVF